ncbi:unnamed protein product [Caenorhabditis brenneri]
MDDEDTVEKRRQRSDDARRAAMRQKIQQQKERDRQIAIDIANVDKKGTKRIVFDDSDDDNETNETLEKEEKTPKNSNSSKRPKLFDSEDEEEGSDGKEFEIKNRHSGAKGEQLMKMESRFNSDPRFKLDDNFAESDSDDEKEAENVEKQEMKMEKDKNRELLSKILGKSVEEKKPTTTETATLKARPFTRFDPENPEHLAWMKEFEASKNPEKKKKTPESEGEDKPSDEENAEDDTKKDEVSGDEKSEDSEDDNFEKAEIFFKMDEKFSAEMKERKDNGEPSDGGFSFLSMMGRKYDDDKPEVEDDDVIEEQPEEVEKTTKKKPHVVEKLEKSLLKVKVSTKFFVDPLSDEKIKSMASNFRRTQTVEKIIDKWAPHRDAIFKLWKKQRRDAVKKQKESFFTNGKRKRKADDENGETVVNVQ